MKLVEEYKYQAVLAMGDVLAEILDAAIPRDAPEMVIVPLPTIGKHVRERGLDHTLRLAKKLARRRHWKVERLLVRRKDTVQVGAKAAERQQQAEQAYEALGKVDAEKRYLLLDDVWTTGASALAAEKALRAAGARQIAMVVAVTGKAANSKNGAKPEQDSLESK